MHALIEWRKSETKSTAYTRVYAPLITWRKYMEIDASLGDKDPEPVRETATDPLLSEIDDEFFDKITKLVGEDPGLPPPGLNSLPPATVEAPPAPPATVEAPPATVEAPPAPPAKVEAPPATVDAPPAPAPTEPLEVNALSSPLPPLLSPAELAALKEQLKDCSTRLEWSVMALFVNTFVNISGKPSCVPDFRTKEGDKPTIDKCFFVTYCNQEKRDKTFFYWTMLVSTSGGSKTEEKWRQFKIPDNASQNNIPGMLVRKTNNWQAKNLVNNKIINSNTIIDLKFDPVRGKFFVHKENTYYLQNLTAKDLTNFSLAPDTLKKQKQDLHVTNLVQSQITGSYSISNIHFVESENYTYNDFENDYKTLWDKTSIEMYKMKYEQRDVFLWKTEQVDAETSLTRGAKRQKLRFYES